MLKRNYVFYNDSDGGGAVDPDYAAYQEKIKFEKQLKQEIASDPVMAEMQERGIIDGIIKNVPKAARDLELLKQLGFVELKRMDSQANTPKKEEKSQDKAYEPPKEPKKDVKPDIPENPSNNSTPPENKDDDIIDWEAIMEGRKEFDFDKLTNVSEFNKMLLNMAINPQKRRALDLYKP